MGRRKRNLVQSSEKEHGPRAALRVSQRARRESRNRKLIISQPASQNERHTISILLAQGQRLIGIWCSEAGISSYVRKRSGTEGLRAQCGERLPFLHFITAAASEMATSPLLSTAGRDLSVVSISLCLTGQSPSSLAST